MWKWILLGLLLWLIWRSWSRLIRETLGHLNKAKDIYQAPPAGADPSPHEAPYAAADTPESGTRMVRCERCGVFVPFGETIALPGSNSPELIRYQCNVACSDSSATP